MLMSIIITTLQSTIISVLIYDWNDSVQRRQSIWKSGVSSFPVIPFSPFPSFPSLFLPSPPFPSLSLSFPSPPSFYFPGRPYPLNQLRGLEERSKLPQWGLELSPSQQTIWCISGPKGAALFCVSFFVGTTGPSYHSHIVCENDWIELAISSRLLCIKLALCPKGSGCGPCLDPPLWY